MPKRYSFLILSIIIFIASCKQPFVPEKTISFSKHEWNSSFQPWIKMEITDTNTLYNIFAVVRHTTAFQYNNLILKYSVILPGDSAKTAKINLPLGDNQHWFGDTLGNIIETRVKINSKPVQLGQGNNIFVLQQIMPQNILEHILNVGIRVEQVD